jgi:hypothetical protein
MLVKEGIVKSNVLKMILKLFALLISLKILEILKDLITVAYGPSSTEVVQPSTAPIIAPQTIMKSKTFQESLK